MIDESRYTKRECRRDLRLLGKVALYTGAGVPYLDGSGWRLHMRFYHPLTWVFYIAGICVILRDLCDGIGDLNREMFMPKRERKHSYFDAKE